MQARLNTKEKAMHVLIRKNVRRRQDALDIICILRQMRFIILILLLSMMA